MLTNDILQALKGYAANMQKKITFVLQTGAHDKRDELVTFLSDIAGVSDNLAFEERDLGDALRGQAPFPSCWRRTARTPVSVFPVFRPATNSTPWCWRFCMHQVPTSSWMTACSAWSPT